MQKLDELLLFSYEKKKFTFIFDNFQWLKIQNNIFHNMHL